MRCSTLQSLSMATLASALVGTLAGGCGFGEVGEIVVTAYGESFIESGISEDDMIDGWEVTFQRFDVTIRDVAIATVPVSVPNVVSLAVPSSGKGHAIGSVKAPAGDHTDATFTISRVQVEGTATDGGETKAFHWDFRTSTTYTDCDATITVKPGESSRLEITIRADRLFYDSLVDEEPFLTFQTLADADENVDGVITQGELRRTDIGSYDTGDRDDIEDLWAWMLAQSRTLGHVNREHHCRVAP